jgi:hypothetical protein
MAWAAALGVAIGAAARSEGQTQATARSDGQAQPAPACTVANHCTQARDIAATVTDFRYSAGGNGLRILTATVRFTNRSAHPVILGYVDGSGIATDDQGNRYGVMGASSVRAIGIISGSNLDTKFSLQPGESSDSRFELGGRPAANSVFGSSYTLDLTTREINPVGTTQFRLGDEYALEFPELSTGARSSSGAAASAGSGAHATATGATATGPAAVSPAASRSPTATAASGPSGASSVTSAASAATAGRAASSACADVARCYDAGAFSAVVTSMTGTLAGRNHVISLILRLTNRTAQPLILAYTASSSSMTDNLGNPYYWGGAGTHDTSVQGIGMVTGSLADPQFVLQPGESRDAKFSVARFNANNTPLGTSFHYDVSLEQLQVLPSQQIRSVRQYAVHFDGLTTGAGDASGKSAGSAAKPSGKSATDAVNANIKTVTNAVDQLKSLFKKPK